MRILFLILVLSLPLLVGASLGECQRVTFSTDIPCTIISSDLPSTGCVENASIFFENGTFFGTLPWDNQTSFCNMTWNISNVNTYSYNSSVENGVITVEQKDNMLAIILFQIFTIGFFVIIGLPHKVGFVKALSWGLALIEFCITVWMIYLNQVNASIDAFLYINTMIVLIVGGFLGFISLIVLMIRLMDPANKKPVNEDGYTKFIFDSK